MRENESLKGESYHHSALVRRPSWRRRCSACAYPVAFVGGGNGRRDVGKSWRWSDFTSSEKSSSVSMTEKLAPYQSQFIDLALKWDILRFGGPYTLKSGRQSPYFFNAGLFNTGSKIQELAECYADRIVESGVEFDVLFGPAYKV